MRFGDAHHIHLRDACGLQRIGQRLAGGLFGRDLLARLDTVGIVFDAFKTGVCRRILALLEMMSDAQSRDGRMKLGVRRARRAMLGPRIHEIRIARPVCARLDMPILRGGGIRILAAMRVHIVGDPPGDRVAAFDPQLAAFAECRLHIHYNQRLGHVMLPSSFDSTDVSHHKRPMPTA